MIGGSVRFCWWRRTQRIRIVSGVSFEIALLETEERPLYQQIAGKVAQLRELGSSLAAISRRLELDYKTVAKAVRWRRSIQSSGEGTRRLVSLDIRFMV
jgi:hypothetical protein